MVFGSADLSERVGLPARDSIVSITNVVPAGKAFAAAGQPLLQILHTNEIDEYEEGAKSAQAAVKAAKALPAGDNYQGTDRKAAKLSIAEAKVESFADLKALIASLPAETVMTNHKPKIGTGSTAGRVKEETRNVRVKAFIYAASRESDNDFHLIVGRNPQKTPEMYMTMELSGLPSASAQAFDQLKAARDAFKQFFKDKLENNLPSLTYDFYQPPLSVEIEGSLFFDITHATGSRPGPKSLKSRMPVVWEVHPITKIVFS